MSYRRIPHPATLTREDRACWRDILAGPSYAHDPHDLADGSRYYVAEVAGRIVITEFHGKALKFERFVFGTREGADEEIARFTRRREQVAEYKARQRGDASQTHTLAVGDILVSTWGYEQTNVDFFEVVGVMNRTVVLRELAQDREHTGAMSGHALPRRGHYIGEPFRKRANPNNGVKLETGYAHPWNGASVSWSSYA